MRRPGAYDSVLGVLGTQGRSVTGSRRRMSQRPSPIAAPDAVRIPRRWFEHGETVPCEKRLDV